MPIYEYECAGCGVFEKWEHINSKQRVKHECGRWARRIMSRHGIGLAADTVYQPVPNAPGHLRLEYKVPLKEIQRRDRTLRDRMLKLKKSGHSISAEEARVR